MIYTYAALMEDVPYANGAPNLSVTCPRCLRWRIRRSCR
jgi:hypothetical protein